MRLNENFILQQLADSWVVLPIGETCLDFTGMLMLNESGAFLWETLEKGADVDSLADALANHYGIARDLALADVRDFLSALEKHGCLEK